MAVFGASGYAGAELLRLRSGTRTSKWSPPRPVLTKDWAVADVHPALAAAYPGLRFAPTEPGVAHGVDVVFCALPHGASQQLVPKLLENVGHVVDLAADFRLRDPGFTQFGTTRSTAAPNYWPRQSTVCPSSTARSCQGPNWGRARLLCHGGDPGVGAPCQHGRRRAHGHCGRRGQRSVRGRAKVGRKHAILHGGRGFHRLWALASPPHPGNGAGHRSAAHFHAPYGSHEPGHPGDCYARPGPGGGENPLESRLTPTPASRLWSYLNEARLLRRLSVPMLPT